MNAKVNVEYFAVPDPTNPDQITYWRNGPRGLKPWPPRAHYGPELLRRDLPEGLHGQACSDWIQTWVRNQLAPWHAAIRAAIDTDPHGCALRFATLTTRCCCCGRTLTARDSRCYAIGPDCRRGLPPAVLEALVDAVGRAHANHLTAS